MKKVLVVFLSILLITSAMPTPVFALTFTDMPSDWSKFALERAIENGLLNGSNGKIMPKDYLTRGQMAAIINKAFGAVEKDNLAAYSDVVKGKWYYDDMSIALKMGTFAGSNGKMYPEDFITREQVFVVLAKALDLPKGSESALSIFKDSNSISSWAKQSVISMAILGYANGSNGMINPKGNMTRAEFAALMNNIIQFYVKTPGTYTNDFDGTVMVNVPGVILKDLTINGNLIIGDGVGTGDVQTSNVIVMGRTLVRRNAQLVEIEIADEAVALGAVVTPPAPNPVGGDGGNTGGNTGGTVLVAVTSVTLDQATLNLTAGGATGTLVATVSPAGATNRNVTWSSSNGVVATVVGGIVTPLAAGTATITVTTVDGNFTATSAVTVVAAPVAVAVTGVTLDQATLNLTVGGATGTLVATLSPADATNKNVTWSSSNEAVATVVGGVVTPLAAGTATITVTTVDGNFTATSAVTVVAPIVSVTGVTLNQPTLNLVTNGATGTLVATVSPAGATNKNVTWSSSDELVATVADGVVTPLAVGAATITVTTVDGNFTATSEVTVVALPVPVAGITLDQATLNLTAGGAVGTLVETVSPAEATDKNVTWSSSDETVATVASGVVTPLAAGTATITVTTVDGNFTATSEVTVAAAPVAVIVTGVTLDQATLNLTVGGAVGTLVETVSPAEATNKSVTWSSSDDLVATVVDGVVTPIAEGTATITVTTVDGNFTATCIVTVVMGDVAELAVTAYEKAPISNLTQIAAAEALKLPAETAVALVTDVLAKEAFEIRILARAAQIETAKANLLAFEAVAQANAETAVALFEAQQPSTNPTVKTIMSGAVKAAADAKTLLVNNLTVKAALELRITTKVNSLMVYYMNGLKPNDSFEYYVNPFTSYLGIDFTQYNMLANKGPVKSAMLDATFVSYTDIQTIFNNAVTAQQLMEVDYLTAFNTAADAASIGTAIATYATQLSISLTYYDALSPEGKTAVETELLGKNFTSGGEIKTAFLIAMINNTSSLSELMNANAIYLGLATGGEYQAAYGKTAIEAGIMAARPIADKTQLIVVVISSSTNYLYLSWMLPYFKDIMGLDFTDYNGLRAKDMTLVQKELIAATMTTKVEVQNTFNSLVAAKKAAEVTGLEAFNNAASMMDIEMAISTYLVINELGNFKNLVDKTPVYATLMMNSYTTLMQVESIIKAVSAAQ